MVRDIVKKNARGREEIVRTEIWLGNKQVKLQFTMPMWFRMEDEICVLDDLYTMMHTKGRLEDGNIPALVELMTDGEISRKDVKKANPATMRALIDEIQSVIAKAVTMHEKKYDDDSVHDEVLEEIEKKETGAD